MFSAGRMRVVSGVGVGVGVGVGAGAGTVAGAVAVPGTGGKEMAANEAPVSWGGGVIQV